MYDYIVTYIISDVNTHLKNASNLSLLDWGRENGSSV